VVFSEGFAHSPEAAAELSALVNSANRTNVAIYIVDPAGLNALTLASGVKAESGGARMVPGRIGDTRIKTDSQADQVADLFTLAREGARAYGGYDAFDLIQRMGMDYDDLEVVAASTGGLLIKDNNSLLDALGRIDRDSREYYTLTYQTENQNYDGAFRKIKVSLANSGFRLRYRTGYWAIAPGEEMMLTPAAAQLFAAAASGSLKANLAARMNASLQLASAEQFALPVSLWVRGDAAALVKASNGFTSGVTFVVVARNAKGELIDVAQKSLHLNLTREGAKEFEKEGLRLTAVLRVPRLESLNTEAVVQFSNGVAASAKCRVDIPPQNAGGARPTSLLLTQRVDAAKKSDAPNPLLVGEYQLALPSQNVFLPSDQLTLYFGLDDVALDKVSGNPNLKLSVVLKAHGKVLRTLPTDMLRPFPDSITRVFFLGQFDLSGLAAGSYTIEAAVDDKTKKTRTTQTAGLSIR
jgi:hypothetical protein